MTYLDNIEFNFLGNNVWSVRMPLHISRISQKINSISSTFDESETGAKAKKINSISSTNIDNMTSQISPFIFNDLFKIVKL